MKRLWIAVALIIIMSIITAAGILSIKIYSKELNDSLGEAKQAAMNEDFETAVEICKQAERNWTKAEKKLKLFVNNSDISEVGLTVSKLEPLLVNGDLAAFYSELKIAQIQLIHLMDMESFSTY